VYTIALSPDGKTVASGSGDGAVRLWNIETGKVIVKWTGHKASIDSSLSFSLRRLQHLANQTTPSRLALPLIPLPLAAAKLMHTQLRRKPANLKNATREIDLSS